MSSCESNTKHNYEDVSLMLAFAEALMSLDVTPPVWELRITGLKQLRSQLTYYERLGYSKSLLEAISEKKSRMVLQISSKKELEKVIHPHAPHYDGNKFTVDSGIVPEEELICWCETSLKAPLNEAGFNRYMEVFRMVFPEDSKSLHI